MTISYFNDDQWGLDVLNRGGFMRRLILFLLILSLLVACSNDQGSLTLPSPLSGETEAEGETLATSDAPRVEVTPTPPLPPTFTPGPMAHQGHLYLLPVSGADGTIQYVHIVRPGDTLAALGQLYGVSADAVAVVNDIRDPNHIEVGEALVIPIVFTP